MATSVEADANARHAVPAVLWTIPFRQSPTSLFHATANMTVGASRMRKFIAKTTTLVVVIVAFVRCRSVGTIVPARPLPDSRRLHSLRIGGSVDECNQDFSPTDSASDGCASRAFIRSLSDESRSDAACVSVT